MDQPREFHAAHLQILSQIPDMLAFEPVWLSHYRQRQKQHQVVHPWNYWIDIVTLRAAYQFDAVYHDVTQAALGEPIPAANNRGFRPAHTAINLLHRALLRDSIEKTVIKNALSMVL